ncbi:hypothetical protein [Mucilaginibacter sp. CSA2-8R]|uniref:hypothetical protein n=1 Tax=Mucilaginibacter sp. CSA2-8R TaxID=3141542 RepID=UPI00315D7612
MEKAMNDFKSGLPDANCCNKAQITQTIYLGCHKVICKATKVKENSYFRWEVTYISQ